MIREDILAATAVLGLLTPLSTTLADDGEQSYTALCAACHGHGREPIGPFPALFGNSHLTIGGALYVTVKTWHGLGNMYPLCAVANDDEIAGVANYLAKANGNTAPSITTDEVKALRPADEDCPPAEQ